MIDAKPRVAGKGVLEVLPERIDTLVGLESARHRPAPLAETSILAELRRSIFGSELNDDAGGSTKRLMQNCPSSSID
jgi:hypothetical protein